MAPHLIVIIIFLACGSTYSTTDTTTHTLVVANSTGNSSANVYPLTTSAELSCTANRIKVKDQCLPCGCAKRYSCDLDTGKCGGKRCKRGRYGLEKGCIYGIISIRNDKANPRHPTNVTCVVRREDAEKDQSGVSLSTGRNMGVFMGPVDTRVLNDITFEAIFYLSKGLVHGENMTCAVEMEGGQKISKTSQSTLYKLPVLSRPLKLHPSAFTGSYLSLWVYRWDPSQGDGGDGPVARYSIKACRHTESQKCRTDKLKSYITVMEVPAFSTALSPVSLLHEFIPGATYSLIYLANRDHMYGPASPPLTLHIPCKEPVEGPTIHSHNYTMDTVWPWRKVNVTFSWQLPSTDLMRCDSVSEIHVNLTNESNKVISSVLNGNISMYSIVLDPYSSYTVLVSYKNSANLSSDVDVLHMNRTPAVTPDEPEISDIHMYNSTSACIHWTKPTHPNGLISTYQVFYSSKDFIYKLACAVPAGSHRKCLLGGLTLGDHYNFTVRAENSVGFGENSTVREYTALLAAPGPVTTLRNSSKTDMSIHLQWEKPTKTGGLNITSYLLVCTNGDFRVEINVPQHALANYLLGYNVTTLSPGVKYTCYASATNEAGTSPITQYLEVFTNPPEPRAPSVPVLMEEKTTDKTLSLKLQARRGCRLYRVVVMEVKVKVKRAANVISMDDIEPESCGRCCTGACYITAQLSYQSLPTTFVVGDNKSYGGYVNRPLTTGKSYKLWYGAGDEVDGVARFEYVSLAQAAVALEYAVVDDSSMSSAALIGVIVAVCASALVMVLLLILFIRHKRNKIFRFRTPDSEKVLELNENGTLLTNGTYQKGDAVSVDSLDYSKQPNGEPVYDNVKLKHYAIMIEELRQYIELKSADDGFKKEYNHIPWGLKFAHDVAKHPDNKLKNRYGNIIAYDHSRVVLKGKHPEQDTDYINASYIDGYKTPKEYIATQGPNKFTVNDLWHMAWQENTAIIVMVTNTIELTKHKCETYWPEEGSKQCGTIRVTLSNVKSLANYKIRTFTMERNDEVRNIKQFHFTAWPDHGTPTHATTLLSFLKKVRQQKCEGDGPIICHCSAGVGRSGTFIALDSLLQQAESEGKIDVYTYVTQMRKQRCNMIQTLDQYIFLHEAILEAAEGFDSTIRLSDFKSEYSALQEKQSKHRSLIDLQYQKLKDILYIDRNTDAASPENTHKNRRSSVIPFNERRVRLVDSTSNYINATYVDDHRKRSALIATQHPLNNTVEDFWKMVFSSRPFAVVTLCAQSASTECTEKHHLPIFWPTPECRNKDFTSVSVELMDEVQQDQMAVTKQSIAVHSKSEAYFQPPPAELDHYLCHFWSSQKNLPTNMDSFVQLVTMLEKRKQENNDGMLIVNCFDGARQSGLYIACHSLVQQMSMDSEVDVPETIRLIRNDQPMFISSSEQFQLCYKFVSEYVERCHQDSAMFTHL